MSTDESKGSHLGAREKMHVARAPQPVRLSRPRNIIAR